MDAMIRLENLSKQYPGQAEMAVDDITLDVPEGEIVVFVGPSGCGKTTVLKVIAGLLPPTTGNVVVEGRQVQGPGTDRGVVFQQPALLPWRTVAENVNQALEFAKIPKGERHDRAERYLELVGLGTFHDHYPGELSGGMQQRVGIARALALEPNVLLMDEPFGALDAITRQQMQVELVNIWETERKSVLFVTHSLDEALLLSDRVIVMNNGTVRTDVIVDIPRPRTRQGLIEDPAARKLRVELESML